MAHWYHEVSTEWLEARRNYITATEISKLVPEYKRSLKADPGTIMPGFAALWAEKMTASELDASSFGPAARGHWMEPYAIESWNMQRDLKMHHWDDCLIVKGRVGFSPDALDIPQELAGEVELISTDGTLRSGSGRQLKAPGSVMEVKSYEPAHHMKCCIKDKMDHDELIQVAAAFHVIDDLEKAYLVFFCPGAPISMKAFEYTRSELEKEIDTVGAISNRYAETAKQCKELSSDLASKFSEEEIYKAMVEEVELNRKGSVLGF